MNEAHILRHFQTLEMTSYGGRDYDYNNNNGYGRQQPQPPPNPYEQPPPNPFEQQPPNPYDQQQHGYGNSYGRYDANSNNNNNNHNYGQRPQIPQTNHYDPNNPVYDLDDISNGFPAFAGPEATVKSIAEDQFGNTKGDTVTRLHPISTDDSAFGVPGGMTTISVLVVVSLVCLLIFIFGLLTLLKKRGPDADAIQYGGGAAFHSRYMVSDILGVSLNVRDENRGLAQNFFLWICGIMNPISEYVLKIYEKFVQLVI